MVKFMEHHREMGWLSGLVLGIVLLSLLMVNAGALSVATPVAYSAYQPFNVISPLSLSTNYTLSCPACGNGGTTPTAGNGIKISTANTISVNSTENLAWIRRLTVSLLAQDGAKASIRCKRKMAGWDDEYLLTIAGNAAG